MFACLCGKGDLASLALEFSPLVEQSAADAVTFDVSGLGRLFGFAQDIASAIARRAAEVKIHANLALAANPDAALCAARGFPGASIVPEGDEAKFLASLPVVLLAPSPELLETLERWGIRRFKELGALPPLGIAERLGPEGLHLRALARGEVERKLRLIVEPLRFEDEMELEYPLELLEPLAFPLASLLNGLTTRLATRGLATNQLTLRLKLEDGAIHERILRLPVPSVDAKAFLKLLQLNLADAPPQAPVVHIRLGMNPVKPRAAQSGLFVPAAPEPVKLELTIARIRAIVGKERAGWPELLDTHRPDAFQIAEQTRAMPLASPAMVQLSFRFFRPSLPARVALSAQQPSFVASERVRGKVLDAAGPWRMSGDWWTAEDWSRESWDIALPCGLYRLFLNSRGWFVEGSYD